MIILLCFRLQDDPPAGVSGAPTENNIMLWNAVIFGYDFDFFGSSMKMHRYRLFKDILELWLVI